MKDCAEKDKIDILSMFPEEIEQTLGNEPRFRAGQIFRWLSNGAGFEEMTNIPSSLRQKLADTCVIRTPKIKKKLVSSIDGTIKYLLELCDGVCVEAVYMVYEHGNTLCVSSEVGCRMGCKFCASTKAGLLRNLTASEILGEVLAAEADTKTRISNIVMMGIGEPLDNFENTVRFLRLVSHPDGKNISLRHVSVSTCGIVPKIYELAELGLPITLSISLHASNNKARGEIMPINSAYPIEALMTACRDYFEATGRRISFEYTLISGKNDSFEAADELAELLMRSMTAKDGTRQPVHVNLIPLNRVDGSAMSRPDKERVNAFQRRLCSRGVNATVRRRLGPDIDAACGQLRIRDAET
ncbi:MAG: 23S rRNA (adenine(2503)-C(2))-methyltransferase RlmN [Firmicutes bacterium]|nr:23S rRNA (adenine(2503)-C(2))-methyltransferase RlmN [Bacillota bacterium]